MYNHYSRTRSNIALQQEDQQHRQELYPPTSELDERYQGEHQHHPTIPSQQQADYYVPNANGTDMVPTDRIIYDKYGRCKWTFRSVKALRAHDLVLTGLLCIQFP